MPRPAPPFGWSHPLSRRQIISAGASALMLRSPSFARAQGTPDPLPFALSSMNLLDATLGDAP